jgi:hypothetical protein
MGASGLSPLLQPAGSLGPLDPGAARALLRRELVRIAPLAARGVRAELLEGAAPSAQGYREGVRAEPLPTLVLHLRAGLPPGATLALILVWMTLVVAASMVLAWLEVPAQSLPAIALFVGPGLALFGTATLLTRDRRLELTPTELRVHPPRVRSWAAPTVLPWAQVQALEVRTDPRWRPTLVATTPAGSAEPLLFELMPVSLEANVPRLVEIYAAIVRGAEASRAV